MTETRNVLDWLAIEFDITKPGNKLESVFALTFDEFVAEVKKRRRSNLLSVAGLRALREEYSNSSTVGFRGCCDAERVNASGVIDSHFGNSSSSLSELP